MADLYHSNFETETSNTVPAGWVNSQGFLAYTFAGLSQPVISGTMGVFSSDNQASGLYTALGVKGNQALRAAFRIPGLTNSTHRSWAVLLRSNSAANQFYRVFLESNDTGLRLSVHNYNVGSTLIASSSSYSFAPAPGDLVHIEAAVIGSAITGRVWIAGTPRPDTITGSGTATASYATVAVTDTSIATGYPGLQLTGPSGSWLGADNVVITDGAGGEDFYYASDTTAPVLSSPTGAATGPTTASASVSMNELGNVWCLTTTNASELAATIKASGTLKSVTTAGVQTFATRTGLTANTAGYKNHFYGEDTANNAGNVSSSAAFTTPVQTDSTAPILSSPAGTKTGSTTATGTVSTNEAGGLLYRVTSANASETKATVLASGTSQVVSATGVQNISATGLPAGTVLRHHYSQVDAAGNQSDVVSSATFTTDAAPANPTVTPPAPLCHAMGGLPLASVAGKVQFLSKTNLAAAPLASVSKTTNADGTITPWAQAGLTSGVLVCMRWISDADGHEGYYDVTPA